MFDDGNGKIDVWRVEDFKLVPQPRDLYGTFFGGDCYVILYTYLKDRREQYIVYYWLVGSLYTLRCIVKCQKYLVSKLILLIFNNIKVLVTRKQSSK
jgi:hypothetical protein